MPRPDNIKTTSAPPSKTQLKHQMQDLQDLGLRLTRLSEQTLKKMALPEDLLEAVLMHKKITANSALKRQTQYIGRLMRDIDPAPIESYLARLAGEDAQHTAYLHRLERERDALLADDAALTQLLSRFAHADAHMLRTTIRNARREHEQNKPPKSYRALFQQLKALYEAPADSESQDTP